jgi:chemotaxis protein MotB
MTRSHFLALLLLAGCAGPEAEQKPTPKPRECPEFDPAKIGDIASLDRENQESLSKVAGMQKTIDELQSQLKAKAPADPGTSVSQSGNRVKVQLSSDLLFQSGSARVSRAGRAALREIADVFKKGDSKRIEVHGHTDDLPAGEKWQNNFELSCARALRVVEILVEQGVDAKLITASGHGDAEPIEAGSSTEARAKNRRVEIFIEPGAGATAATEQ